MAVLFGTLMVLVSLIGLWHGFSQYWRPKPFRMWSGRRAYYLIAACDWALGFGFIGAEKMGVPTHPVGCLLVGSGMLLMVFTPCSTQIFNEDKFLKLLRGAVFTALAFGFFGFAYLLPVAH